ncbi:MAG TPA: O-methyltransferase [Jiangellaceae bacterium]|nr:O-methyltransferase [Jiangellaceae bacterium]
MTGPESSSTDVGSTVASPVDGVDLPSSESWTYAETFTTEPPALQRARARGRELRAQPISPGAGAALRLLVAALGARTVVEVGTGAGVSGLYLLEGMSPEGVLTSVDLESEHQRMAREAYADAGVPANRARLIAGAALEVLPRLNDASYDLVFCDGDKAEYGQYLTQAVRLLRPGGVVAFDNALWHNRVADPAQRDPETVAVRTLGRTIVDDEGMLSALLPVGDGLLVAVKRE